MNDDEMNCARAAQLAWQLEELLEDEVEFAWREQFEAHCESCEECRAIWEKERWLTAALVRGEQRGSEQRWSDSGGRKWQNRGVLPPRGMGRWVGAVAFLAVAVFLGALAFWPQRSASPRAPEHVTEGPENEPRVAASLGTIRKYPVVSPVSFRVHRPGRDLTGEAVRQADHAVVMANESEPLAAANHLHIARGFFCLITLSGCGELQAVGPAIIGLDRIGDQWKVTIFEGFATISILGGETIWLAHRQGQMELTSGRFIVNDHERIEQRDESAVEIVRSLADGVMDSGPQREGRDDPSVLLARGLMVFQDSHERLLDTDVTQTYREAAAVLNEVLQHPGATREQRNIAGFYRAAALSNAELHREAMEAAWWWMDEFNGRDDEIMLHIIGRSHWELGERERGREYFERIIEIHPATPFRPALETLLKEGDARPDAPRQSRTKPPLTSDHHAGGFMANQRNGYLVIEVGLAADNPSHDGFRSVAERVRRLHHAQSATFDGHDFDWLRSVIAKHHPRYVLFVIPPELLDVNFQRQVFLLSPTLDNDRMSDFAWGYLTARDGAAVHRLWDRIERLHQRGLGHRHWVEVAVVGGGARSERLEQADSALNRTAGFETTILYLGLQSNDPEVLTFIDEHLAELERASVIAIFGNGDPQGIWLFDDRRNADRSKHWQFDPAKVGYDPQGELVRLKADRFRTLNLNGPIIWSGTCHSGACRRVFVERDIVATFGSSDQVELYEMDPDESLCLAWIDAGAGALLVPIGSNHGMAAIMEQQFALQHGSSLGDAIKSTYDDVFFQAGGLPAIKIVKAGQSANDSEPIMQGGGANRILIGDPALKLFAPSPVPGETTTVSWDRQSAELVVTVHWEKGFHATGWNMFGEDREASYRINTRVELTGDMATIFGGEGRTLAVSCVVTDDAQQAIDCHPRHAIEFYAGQTFLHLQADMRRDTNYQSSFTATFNIRAAK